MPAQAYSTTSITEAILGFFQFLRGNGFNIGLDHSKEALEIGHTDIINRKEQFKIALAALCCTSREEQATFYQLFKNYWDTNPLDLSEMKYETKRLGLVEKKTNKSLVMLGQGKPNNDPKEEAKAISGSNTQERLQKTDFSKIIAIDEAPLNELADRLFKEFALRMRRKQKARRDRGIKLHMTKTIRKSIETGGEPISLFRSIRKQKKRRLIMLLDVSGSMDKYSFYLLRFIYALKRHFRSMEAFVFSTKLVSITKAMKWMQIDAVLHDIASHADHWSGGTRIGECLQTFNDRYAKYILHGSPIVIILSDGLETGNPVHLAKEMEKIKNRSKSVIWLNPLKGMQGYEPIAAGMQAALPSIHRFKSAHNLESLLELEDLLHHV